MAYDYIRQIEVDNTSIPVGNYEFVTYRSASSATTHAIQVSTNRNYGFKNLEITATANKGTSKVIIPLYRGEPHCGYFVETTSADVALSTISYSDITYSSDMNVGTIVFVLTYPIAVSIAASIQVPEATIASAEGSDATYTDLEIHPSNALIENLHYGDTLPDAGNKGRIFFKKFEE